jgi:hypothetical protein
VVVVLGIFGVVPVDSSELAGDEIGFEVDVEVVLLSKELIGDQRDASSDDVEFICAELESEALDSELKSVLPSGLACSILDVEFAPVAVVALSFCCPLAGAAEDDVCSGLMPVPILILT